MEMNSMDKIGTTKGVMKDNIHISWIPTTKWCPKCHNKQKMPLSKREYVCSCGYREDRDVHSAKSMLAIKDLVFKNNVVPTEHREVTLTEFKAAVADSFVLSCGKPGR